MSCSRQMLAKKLQAETKEETQNQLPSDAMIELYKKMSLEDLGNTKLVAGKCSGQTCKMVREEDPGYVAWLLQHQGKNPRFQALFLYVEKLEQLLVKKSKGGQKEEKQEKPQPQVTRLENDNFPLIHGDSRFQRRGRADDLQCQTKPKKTSGLSPSSGDNTMTDVMKEMILGIQTLQQDMEKLSMMVVNHQQHSAQIQEALMTLQNHILGQEHRLCHLEGQLAEFLQKK